MNNDNTGVAVSFACATRQHQKFNKAYVIYSCTLLSVIIMSAFETLKRPRSQKSVGSCYDATWVEIILYFPCGRGPHQEINILREGNSASPTITLFRLIKYERMSCGKTAHVTPARGRGGAHAYSEEKKGANISLQMQQDQKAVKPHGRWPNNRRAEH